VAASVPYDYSQPVVVNNYYASDADAAQAAPGDSATEQATKLFDAGLELFKSADYRVALGKFDLALRKLPGDPVVHEVRALALFALGEYKESAAALNSLLSSAPGMDWTTLSSLYGSVDEYQAQLRKLEQFVKANPNDASAAFVLAYQYLVIGAPDAAARALQVVVKNQPHDTTAKRMLAALKPAEKPTPAQATEVPPDPNAPQTDLVGKWQAKSGNTTISLSIDEDSQFTWKASDAGKPAVELSGQLFASDDKIVLESASQGSMAGSVKSLGPDKWRFALSGAPASDPGLGFERVGK
jgi:tetratricopeptide (TPR) repeat protein